LVSHFYHFLRISYNFPSLAVKRKGKRRNSDGLKPARTGPRTGKHAHARPRCQLCKKALGLQITGEEPRVLFICVSDICSKAPALLFLRKPRSMTTNGGKHAFQRASTGRNTQRLSFLLGRHQILPLATLIPLPIAKF
jgi:hypothetical protein